MTPLEALRPVARRLHAHYDVEPELEVLPDGARRRSALLVSLWGVHAPGARARPACPRSREIAAGLGAIAEYVLAGDPLGCGEPLLVRPALYVSRAVPGADEIRLTIRIASRAATAAAGAAAAEERSLTHLRARLRELDVREG